MLNHSGRMLVMPQVMGHAAVLAGQSVARYASDAVAMYRCQMEALDFYGYDAVFPAADHSLEAESLGAELDYALGGYPVLVKPALEDVREWDRLNLPDPLCSGRMPVTIEACSMLRRKLGEDVLVIGKILGPMTIAGQTLGLEKLLFGLMDHPEATKEFLNFATEVAISYGKALLQAGAHLLVVYDPMATPEVIPLNLFQQIELPNLKYIFDVLKADGNNASWLQFWLKPPAFPLVKEMGVDMVSIDSHLKLEEVIAGLPGLTLIGNLGAFAFIESSPEEIRGMAKESLRVAGSNGNFILGGGCELPLEARPENIRALVDVVKGQPVCKG